MSFQVDRLEDMSPEGKLELLMQTDGDMIVVVHQADDGSLQRASMASVEFCTRAGGGASPETLKALHDLMIAMAKDNRDAKTHRLGRHPGADVLSGLVE